MTLRPAQGERMKLARAAEGYVGAAFRLHGRDPVTGLDCVGLVLAAMAAIGQPIRLPLRYGLRNSDPERFLRLAVMAGFTEAAAPFEPGDVLVLEPGPAQLHLAIVVLGGVVHAHAGLRRVVRTPFPLCWPVAGQWRLTLSAPA
jgi:cell wall-associated NlpC family hydrolase